jgi:2-polyprenyl-3-methyl-5-hydroxy-6-metoxy-1,4-benzoquinol methylase
VENKDLESILERIENLEKSIKFLSRRRVIRSGNKNDKIIDFSNNEPSKQPSKNFSTIKKLILSNEWPSAVDEEDLCQTEEDKIDRAETILDEFDTKNLFGLNLLDFGCGEGHVGYVAANQGANVINYDQQEPNDFPNVKKTTNWSDVSNNIFDIIILHDVLDHAKNPREVLQNIRSVCKKGSTVYVRCHPWCSRFGAHQYRFLNKAFIHLVLNEDEMQELNINIDKNIQKIIHPKLQYSQLMEGVGFKIHNSTVKTTPVEQFFEKTPEIAERIKWHWRLSHDLLLKSGKQFPHAQIGQSWINYILTAN